MKIHQFEGSIFKRIFLKFYFFDLLFPTHVPILHNDNQVTSVVPPPGPARNSAVAMRAPTAIRSTLAAPPCFTLRITAVGGGSGGGRQ